VAVLEPAMVEKLLAMIRGQKHSSGVIKAEVCQFVKESAYLAIREGHLTVMEPFQTPNSFLIKGFLLLAQGDHVTHRSEEPCSRSPVLGSGKDLAVHRRRIVCEMGVHVVNEQERSFPLMTPKPLDGCVSRGFSVSSSFVVSRRLGIEVFLAESLIHSEVFV
jgi:hypothetical protein